MAQLTNSPAQHTMIRVEARKSFSFGLWIVDAAGRPVDLTGCELTIVAKPVGTTGASDAENLLAPNALANIAVPAAGYAKFDLQASTLNHPIGSYVFVIVLRTSEGYSSVIVKGTLEIEHNPEISSIASSFSGVNPPQSLVAHLQERNVITVEIGGQPPPGMNWVTDEQIDKLIDFDPESIALVPTGGAGGYVLTKLNGNDYAMAWRPVGNGPFGLDATGMPSGLSPVTIGDDTWVWGTVGIDATGVAAGWAPVANGDNTWSWSEVETDVEIPTPNWNATVGQPGYISNKPSLGTAAAADVEDFMDADTLVSEMPGIHFATTIPVSGSDGHLYFVYTP